MKKIFIEDIAIAIEETMDGWEQFLNRKTGEIVSLPSTDNAYVDFEDEDKELMEEFDSSGYYVRLPDQYEINEYEIMEDFADEQNNDYLFRALNGRKTFRHFKDAINELGIEKLYYEFRYQAFCKIATDWCKDNGIACKAREKHE